VSVRGKARSASSTRVVQRIPPAEHDRGDVVPDALFTTRHLGKGHIAHAAMLLLGRRSVERPASLVE